MPTEISYADETINLFTGCRRAGHDCEHCYAERIAFDMQARGIKAYKGTVDGNGRWTGKINVNDNVIPRAFSFRSRKVIFWNSMGDSAYEDLPDIELARHRIIMHALPQHYHLVFTKRAKRLGHFCSLWRDDGVRDMWMTKIEKERPIELKPGSRLDVRAFARGAVRSNIWYMLSVGYQKAADDRLQRAYLEDIAGGGQNWGISYEPAIGPVDWRRYVGARGDDGKCVRCGEEVPEDPAHVHECPERCGPRPGWILVGCEAGPGRRRCDDKWIHKTIYRFHRAGKPVYVKQVADPNGEVVRDVKLFPPHLAVQDYPWDDPGEHEPVEQTTLF